MAKTIYLLIAISFIFSCKEKEPKVNDLCSYNESISQIISFEIPENSPEYVGGLNLRLIFRDELRYIYDLSEEKFLSEKVYSIGPNYFMYESTVESKNCGSVLVIGVYNYLKKEFLFNIGKHFLVEDIRWKETNQSLIIYLLSSSFSETKVTYEIVFNFDIGQSFISVDDGFSNWYNEKYPNFSP